MGGESAEPRDASRAAAGVAFESSDSGAGRGAAGASCACCEVEIKQADPDAAREHKRQRGPQNAAEAPAPEPQAATLPAAGAAEAAWAAQLAQSHVAHQGTALALHLCTTALNQSSENHMMLVHLSNELMFLRGMFAQLARQNAAVQHIVAVQLARKRKHRARAAQAAANAANMANNALSRDAPGDYDDGVTRGIPYGQYPDHSSSDSELSDSDEPSALEAGDDDGDAAGEAGAVAATTEIAGRADGSSY